MGPVRGSAVWDGSAVWPLRVERPYAEPSRSFGVPCPGRPLWAWAGVSLQPEWFVLDRADMPAAVLDVPPDVWPLDPASGLNTVDGPAAAWLGGWTTAVDVVDELTGQREMRPTDPDFPPGLAHRLATSPDRRDRRAAATAPSCSAAALTVLARDDDPEVRRQAAQHPNAPLELLAADRDWQVRCEVAGSPACGPELLTALADDPEDAVRAAVAVNPRIPPTVLARLLPRIGAAARRHREVAGNPALDEAGYLLLTGERVAGPEGRPEVAVQLDFRLCPPQLLAEHAGMAATVLHPRMPLEQVVAWLYGPVYCSDSGRWVPKEKLPEHRQRRDRPDRYETAVRTAVVRSRPDLPGQVLEKVLTDGITHDVPNWVLAVLEHPNADVPALIERVLHDAPARERRDGSDSYWVQALAAATTTPAGMLEQLVTSPNESTRHALAGNPACSRSVAEALAGDDNWRVRGQLGRARPAGDPVLDRLLVEDLTPRKLALHLSTHPAVAHRSLPQVLRAVAASPGALVGATRDVVLAIRG